MKIGFKAWLDRPECYPVLSRCLEGCFRKYKRPDWLADGGDPDELSDQVALFWEFLKGLEGVNLASLEAVVAQQDWEALRRKIKFMYSLFMKEKNRDPLYQRVRQVLHAAGEEFGYQPRRTHSHYGAISESARNFESYSELVAFGMKPFFPNINVAEINSKDVILDLARSFKDQVDGVLGSASRIPIREFCSFIRDGYDVDLVYPMPGKVNQPLEISKCEEEYETLNTHGTVSDWPYSEEALKELSEVLVRRIEQQDLLLLFCLVRYCRLKQREVAKALGYSGPSGIHVPLARLDALIREFFSLLDGFSSPDADEGLLLFFGKLLLDSCKDDDCSRYS